MGVSQVQQSRTYYNFINAIRSPVTRRLYNQALQRYLKHYSLELEQLLTITDKQERIIDYLLSQQGYRSRQLSRDALKKFYEMNDVVLNWRKISAYLGEFKKVNRDRAYTHEEIKTIVDAADFRFKVIINLLASTGVRIGAVTHLACRNLERIGDIYKVTVYENSKEEYFTFCTPECAKAIDNYFGYRERCGEKLEPNSLLIRKRFDIDDIEAVRKNVSPISTDTLSRDLDKHLVRCGLKTVDHVNKHKRKEVARAHGFRKFFTTQLVNSGLIPEIREMLLGHKIGLTGAYYRPTVDEMLKEYHKAIDLLTIDSSNRPSMIATVDQELVDDLCNRLLPILYEKLKD
jgi:integrase